MVAYLKNPGSKGRIGKLLEPLTEKRVDELTYWRERILNVTLMTGLGIGLVVLLPVLFVYSKHGMWWLISLSLATFTVGLAMLHFGRLAYPLRALVTAALCYLFGITIIWFAGPVSGGYAWLFAFAVFSGLYLGLRAALWALLINTLTLSIILFLLVNGQFESISPSQIIFEKTILALVSFILTNVIVAVSVSVLVEAFEATGRKEEDAYRRLIREREDLLEAKEQLKQSESKYRLLAENIFDVIWTMDMNMEFDYISPAAEAQQGWPIDELIQMKLEDIMTPRSYQLVTETMLTELAQAEATGNDDVGVTLEVQLRHKNGSTYWAEVNASFILDADGQPSGLLGVTRDISERKRMEAEKEELRQKLDRSRKMEALGLLAGGVAHDLNNVLTGIVSYPDLLLMDLPVNSPLRDSIVTIKESGQKAATIVQDLLTLARRGVTVSETVNLNRIIDEYLCSPEHAKLLSYHPHTAIETQFETGLPNIKGSPVHLRKTIMNLISNATEAQLQGGEILISTESRHLDTPLGAYQRVAVGDYVLVRVTDSGQGIDEDDLQRIFEPFYTKKVMGRSGTGLGMAVVWGTVKDHKGYIDVHSTPGQGTTFELYFPMTTDRLSDPKRDTTLALLLGSGQRILVVDDMGDQRKIARTILNRLGYAVDVVASGEEAIEYVKGQSVDLVILDMIMEPNMDGLATYEGILSHRPGQKAIIASGFAETKRVKKAIALGVNAYIKKPYTIDKLAIAVHQALGLSEQKSHLA